MVIAASTKFKISNKDIASIYTSIDFAIRNNKLSDDGKQYYYVTDLFVWGDLNVTVFPSSKVQNLSFTTTGSFKSIHSANVYTYILDGFGRVLRSSGYVDSPNYEIYNSQTIVKIAGGNSHLVALSNSGTIYTTGYNDFGQLGSGNTTSSLSNWVTLAGEWYDIAAADKHTIALKSDGSLWAWGLNNTGQLGDNSIINRSTPTQVASISTNWDSVHAGTGVGFAVNSLEQLWAWGSGTSYARGDGSLVNRSTPAQVGSDVDWGGASIGLSYAVKSNGTLWTWGLNTLGVLGHGDTTTRSVPTQVGSETTWYDAYYTSFDDGFMAALKNDGTLWISGTGNASPIYSEGSQSNTFVQIVNINPSEESPNFIDFSYSNTKKFGAALRQTWAASGYASNAYSSSADILFTSNTNITIPDRVTAISAVAVGGGGGGRIKGLPIQNPSTARGGVGGSGGSLVWSEGIQVSAGDNIAIQVGTAGIGDVWTAPTSGNIPLTGSISNGFIAGSNGGSSIIYRNSNVVMTAGGGINMAIPIWSVNPTFIGSSHAGYFGGTANVLSLGANSNALGGGGAAGWFGDGGNSANTQATGSPIFNDIGKGFSSFGGGGGGAGNVSPGSVPASPIYIILVAQGKRGGGVGLYGPGPNGVGGISTGLSAFQPDANTTSLSTGTSGSYGSNTLISLSSAYGAGGGGGSSVLHPRHPSPTFRRYLMTNATDGAPGAVRLVYGAYSLKVT
jgi:alpha-tubulin suppressor-like RCC1 family protein